MSLPFLLRTALDLVKPRFAISKINFKLMQALPKLTHGCLAPRFGCLEHASCYDLTGWLGETEVGWGQSRDYSDVG